MSQFTNLLKLSRPFLLQCFVLKNLGATFGIVPPIVHFGSIGRFHIESTVLTINFIVVDCCDMVESNVGVTEDVDEAFIVTLLYIVGRRTTSRPIPPYPNNLPLKMLFY